MLSNYTKERNNFLLNTVAKNLEKRNFRVFCCQDRESAIKQIAELIKKDDIIAWGGSLTLQELNVIEYLEKNGYKTLNRDNINSPEEKNELYIKSFSADVYLMSSNALTEDGVLVNIDGLGNRVAALCFGPKKVIMVVGANKIVKTVDDAISRARNIAAPMNVKKVSSQVYLETPCQKTGVCMNCKSPDSICTQIVTTRLCSQKGRINVILVNDTLGF